MICLTVGLIKTAKIYKCVSKNPVNVFHFPSDLHNAPIRRDDRVLEDIVGAEAVARRGGRVDPAAEEEAADPDTAALAVDVGELGGRQGLLHSLPLCAGSQKDL